MPPSKETHPLGQAGSQLLDQTIRNMVDVHGVPERDIVQHERRELAAIDGRVPLSLEMDQQRALAVAGSAVDGPRDAAGLRLSGHVPLPHVAASILDVGNEAMAARMIGRCVAIAVNDEPFQSFDLFRRNNHVVFPARIIPALKCNSSPCSVPLGHECSRLPSAGIGDRPFKLRKVRNADFLQPGTALESPIEARSCRRVRAEALSA